MLENGATPSLSLVDTNDAPIDLGGRSTFVYFMRALSCAQCNAAVSKIAKDRSVFDDAGVRVLIAVPEDRDAAAKWKAKKGVPFEVVVGQAGTAHEEVGLLRKVFGLLQQSGSVLLDGSGVVRHTHVSTNPGASYNEAEITGAVAALA